MSQRQSFTMRTIWVKASPALLGIVLLITGTRFNAARGAEQRSISVGDCTFSTRPDDFLARESRIRRGVSDTALKLNKILPRTAAAAPRSASSVPHRNFIDDYIFNAMAAQKVAPAALTTDAEFFRRINLDLIGKIPTSD